MLNIKDFELTPDEIKDAEFQVWFKHSTDSVESIRLGKRKAIANAATAKCLGESAEVVDDLLDSMGLGIDNFPLSAWNRWQAIKDMVKK